MLTMKRKLAVSVPQKPALRHLPTSLIARSKLSSHTEGSAQLPSGRNDLSPFLMLECVLIMVIGPPPARLNAQKRVSVGPQRHVGNSAKIQHHPASTRRVDVRKLRS